THRLPHAGGRRRARSPHARPAAASHRRALRGRVFRDRRPRPHADDRARLARTAGPGPGLGRGADRASRAQHGVLRVSDGVLVLAAGGVILRQRGDGETQVLLVYRGKRRDWTFPKGKVEAGETDEACAVREVEEETGLRCALDDELPSVAYIDRKGRDKR